MKKIKKEFKERLKEFNKSPRRDDEFKFYFKENLK